MSPLVPLVMYGWIPAVLYIFMRFPAKRAVVVSFLVAWLFLPQVEFPLPGLPDYTKMSATCYGILLATAIYDSNRLKTFQFGWVDLPMLTWCLSPFMSSLANGLGPYDGFSSSLAHIVSWGAPYFLGRLYLSSLDAMRQLAVGMFISGLVYSPLCIFENLMSPQLHRMVYGFYVRQDMSQAIRYGGFRPTVFMEHGLAVGMWMMAATLIGFWLWRLKLIKEIWGIPMGWWVLWLFFVFLNARSTGAYLYFLMGLGILFSAKWFRTSLPLIALICFISFYLYNNVVGNFSSEKGAGLTSFIADTIGADRAQSLEFRWQNEDILGAKARERMVFGWGGWGRSRVYDPWGKDISITDSLWIIAFGTQGVVGVTSMAVFLMLPSWGFAWLRYPARVWTHPTVAPATLLVVILPLFMLDCVLNAMPNPVFVVACGGISGVVLKQPERLTKKNATRAIAPSTQRPMRPRPLSQPTG